MHSLYLEVEPRAPRPAEKTRTLRLLGVRIIPRSEVHNIMGHQTSRDPSGNDSNMLQVVLTISRPSSPASSTSTARLPEKFHVSCHLRGDAATINQWRSVSPGFLRAALSPDVWAAGFMDMVERGILDGA